MDKTSVLLSSTFSEIFRTDKAINLCYWEFQFCLNRLLAIVVFRPPLLRSLLTKQRGRPRCYAKAVTGCNEIWSLLSNHAPCKPTHINMAVYTLCPICRLISEGLHFIKEQRIRNFFKSSVHHAISKPFRQVTVKVSSNTLVQHL